MIEPVVLALILIGITVIVIGIAWWLLITTEGVYLGNRVVAMLYDLYAYRYDQIKKFDPEWEDSSLAKPILEALQDIPHPLILDVGTGTGRLPLTLFRQPEFAGKIIGVDNARRMLRVTAEKLASHADRLELIYAPAEKLPFADNTFDMVVSLEALEFTSDPIHVIREIVRVARPGGAILITNRKEIRVMPGKIYTREKIQKMLRQQFKLEDVTLRIWQIDYDLVWAFKPVSQVRER